MVSYVSGTAKNVGIVGAGIGGLTAAIALLKRGHDVTIFEQASEPGEIGAGIVIQPNALKVLRALDVEDDVSRISVEPDRHLLRNWRTGNVVFEQRMKDAFRERFNAGYLQAHRADLIDALLKNVPSKCINFGCTALGVRSDTNSAAIHLSNGVEKEFDLVVGADGIKSVVRASIFGPEAPRFTGNVCWRGVVPTSDLPEDLFSSDIHVWTGPDAHVVNYYVRRGELMSFIAILEADDWRAESWSIGGDRQELLRTFSGWNPSLLTLFERAAYFLKWALFDRDPLPTWSKGRVTLLGDAAHAMLPHLAQGAAMSMEDGYTLAAVLEREPDLDRALKQYEAIRIPRATRTQLGARAQGKENHLKSPFARFVRDVRYRIRRMVRPTSYAVEWLYDYDVQKTVG